MFFYMSERKRGRREEKNAMQMRKMKRLWVKARNVAKYHTRHRTSLVVQMVKSLPAMQETLV